MEHIELKLKLIRDLKSQTMVVPRGTSNGNGSGNGSAAVPRGTSKGMESVNVPCGTSKGLVTIHVVDFLNTITIMDGNFIIAHCKIVNGTASVVQEGWAGRSYTLLGMLREVGY